MLHGLLYHQIYKPIVLNYKNLLKLQLKWLDIIGDSKVAQKRQCQQNTIRSLRIFHPKWWLQIICLDVSLNPILIIRICFSHSWNQFNESLTQIPRRDISLQLNLIQEVEKRNWPFVAKGTCVLNSRDALRVCYLHYKKEMFNYPIWVALAVL